MKQDDDELKLALRKLRAIKPSPQLEERLERALVAAERQERARVLPRKRWWSIIHANLALLMPALGSVALAAHVVLEQPAFDDTRMAEHELELPAQGHGALDLSFLLHHHADDYASVSLQVPHGLQVTTSAEAVHDAPAPSCNATGCTYQFLHPTTSSAPHVQLRVSAPGRYRMKVEHSSPTRRVREVFVIHAGR